MTSSLLADLLEILGRRYEHGVEGEYGLRQKTSDLNKEKTKQILIRGVNFIYILQVAFLHVSVLCSFQVVFVFLCQMEMVKKKAVCKMLVKLTTRDPSSSQF